MHAVLKHWGSAIPKEHRAKIADMMYNKFGIAGSTTSGLRLCPHLYNTHAHIDRAIAGVKEALATIS